jgi:hypothetical protein
MRWVLVKASCLFHPLFPPLCEQRREQRQGKLHPVMPSLIYAAARWRVRKLTKEMNQ